MMRTPDGVTYLHGDHLGSTSLTTDESGAVVSKQRYYPYGDVRDATGTTPTDFGFTGQRADASTGLMYYRARYYDPTLGRFVSADAIVPEPGNPQSLNRYAYVKNNPLRYVDPSGNFEKEEIDRYLEYQLGITDVDDREKIIYEWRNDESWWSVIGPRGATYGDVLDGVEMRFGQKVGNIHGFFRKDEVNETFQFVMGGEGAVFRPKREMNSLVDFYSETSDILWLSQNSSDDWVYRGGTELATDGARIRWGESLNSAKHTVYALGFGVAGISGLAPPEPLTKALAVISFIKCGDEVIKAASATQRFRRSMYANARLTNWVD